MRPSFAVAGHAPCRVALALAKTPCRTVRDVQRAAGYANVSSAASALDRLEELDLIGRQRLCAHTLHARFGVVIGPWLTSSEPSTSTGDHP